MKIQAAVECAFNFVCNLFPLFWNLYFISLLTVYDYAALALPPAVVTTRMIFKIPFGLPYAKSFHNKKYCSAVSPKNTLSHELQ